MITRTLGKNTLGGGERMKVNMKTYDRSTHDLSRAWRSTMGVGTLVPCLKEIALPGDTFDIDIESLIFTNPTIGPLFGQYKLQIDIFTCPMRLYIARLHNNEIGIAMNMEQVKFPIYNKKYFKQENPTKENQFKAINQSSLLAYLGNRGRSTQQYGAEIQSSNALPLLMYWDIFANYYCNKQENEYYSIGISAHQDVRFVDALTYDSEGYVNGGYLDITWYDVKENVGTFVCKDGKTISTDNENFIICFGKGSGELVDKRYYKGAGTQSGKLLPITKDNPIKELRIDENNIRWKQELNNWNITTLNDIREDLLKQGKTQKIFTSASGKGTNPIEWLINFEGTDDKAKSHSSFPLSGLALKTYQNDIFTNYVNNERITNVTNKTKVSTAGNAFTIDALNISQKIYNYQNRLAASNGTYKDWIEVGYTQDYGLRTETPLYEGGYSDTIIFESVVNVAQTEYSPLGELGGKGKLAGNKKGGKLHINVDEPSYIIGIVSITPYIDYCEGNDWDDTLDNMGQLHVPELDGIGYEDIKTRQLAYWASNEDAYAKTTAWQNYMTSYNKNYGEFCKMGSMAHMVLNRYVNTGSYESNQYNLSTYINPEAYNYTFADTTLTSQNFQVQIGFGIQARRKMSARQIPKI